MPSITNLRETLRDPSEYELPLIAAEEGRASSQQDTIETHESERPNNTAAAALPALQQRFLNDARHRVSNPIRRVPGYARAKEVLNATNGCLSAASFACRRHFSNNSETYSECLGALGVVTSVGLSVWGLVAIVMKIADHESEGQ